MADPQSDKFFCEHPDPDKEGVRIDHDKYAAMKKALLRHIPARKDGVAFGELRERVATDLPDEIYAGASVSWYLTVVKLDLEARGSIERVPGVSPQHLRRVRSGH